MNNDIKKLKGSNSGDDFRWYRKQAYPSDWYACDGDLFLIDKTGIICLIDYKYYDTGKSNRSDTITWAEIITYTDLIKKGIPVFIVEGMPQYEMCIYKYIPIDSKHYDLLPVDEFNDYALWEENIRLYRKRRGTQ